MTDEFQQSIIEKQSGVSLLLAGPGCGKTHILAQRIIYAHEHCGVPYGSMLCLTFTNRASREMLSRIEQALGTAPGGLFVGNIHKFCLQFLYRNRLIPADANVIDEEDRAEYLASEFEITAKSDVKDFCDLNTYLYQQDNMHPAPICRRLSWSPTDKQIARVRQYMRYKEENRLLDFDDIILRCYTALLSPEASDFEMTGYSWIQIDEVQDVTPLQLEVVRMVTSRHRQTTLYLGDEQQAIFAFLGAGGAILKQLKQLCRNDILRLQRNYRSPKYLVDLTNQLAVEWLDADESLLPVARRNDYQQESLVYFVEPDVARLNLLAASAARHLLRENPSENVAVLTRTNEEARRFSNLLTAHGMEHFLISQHDVFASPGFKTIWAHLAVVANPDNNHSWVRLLYQTKATKTLKAAREYAKALGSAGVRPHELFELFSSERSTNLQRFTQAMEDDDCIIAVIDTETTGLDLFRDEIVEFAAVKMRGGRIIEGSRINFYIESKRPLPRVLASGVKNPLCTSYETAPKLPAQLALRKIAEFLADCNFVAGHNMEFDVGIIRSSFERINMPTLLPAVIKEPAKWIDSLTVARLIYPKLRHYRLGYLLSRLQLAGENSHNAADDVDAAATLLIHLMIPAKVKLENQRKFLAGKNYMAVAAKLYNEYGEFFARARQLLRQDGHPHAALLHEIKLAHSFFVAAGHIKAVDKFPYIHKLLESAVIDTTQNRNFREQLFAHLMELRTFNESDLFAHNIVDKRLSVMTVHKAKGLEMDNVVIVDASSNFGTIEERARVLYVAFSRARKRLYVGTSSEQSEIVASLLPHFRIIPTAERQALIMKEYLNHP